MTNLKRNQLKENTTMKGIDNKLKFSIDSDEFERRDGTIEKWYMTDVNRNGYKYTFVRPFKVIKVLNQNLHLN